MLSRPRRRARELAVQPGVLDLWQLDLVRPETEADRALLTEQELAKAERIIIPLKSRQSLRARAELRRILALYLARDPADLRFVYGEHDKPALDPAMQGELVLSFNLSHSEAVGVVGVMLAEAPVEIGVDVEHARDGREFVDIAESFFAPDEVEAFRRIHPSQHRAAFYRAWTRKEAYLKALGTGLSFPSTGFSITYGADEAPRVLRTTREGDHPERWQLADLPCPPDYAAAACWEGEACELRYFWGPTSEPPAKAPGNPRL